MTQGSDPLALIVGAAVALLVAALGISILFDLKIARKIAFSGLPRREFLERFPKRKGSVYFVGVFFSIVGVAALFNVVSQLV